MTPTVCGSFTQSFAWVDLLFGLSDALLNLQPRYNVAPSVAVQGYAQVSCGF